VKTARQTPRRRFLTVGAAEMTLLLARVKGKQ
jgi:hypothetical protein